MNQKNIFTIIGAILLLQGIVFYLIADKMVLGAFPTLNNVGQDAAEDLVQVISMMSITIGLISFAARNTPQLLWAYALGFSLIGLNSLKHLFIDQVNVPIPAMVIQLGIALVCGYLWMQSRKSQA